MLFRCFLDSFPDVVKVRSHFFFDCMSRDNEVHSQPMTALEDKQKHARIFARFGDGHWYAILPGMADGLRKSGAVVQTLSYAAPEPEHAQ